MNLINHGILPYLTCPIVRNVMPAPLKFELLFSRGISTCRPLSLSSRGVSAVWHINHGEEAAKSVAPASGRGSSSLLQGGDLGGIMGECRQRFYGVALREQIPLGCRPWLSRCLR
ncbi:hypothetical protein TRVL_10304 [Trypanosoma vivax]|nr:hypothetical protein TRVL_10304 [Trypanosoma vivax]